MQKYIVMLFHILGLEPDVPTPVAGAEVPTPPDSEEDMDLRQF